MSEPKFTPGPWSFIQENHIRYALLRAGEKILCIFKSRPEEYDAHLIAAAPDLYAELQNIANADPKKWDEDTRDQFQQWAQNRAKAALAKARGGKDER